MAQYMITFDTVCKTKGWWYDFPYTTEVIEAKDLKELKKKLEEFIRDNEVVINKNPLKFSPIYMNDAKTGLATQVGWVINFTTQILNDNYEYKKIAIELWTSVKKLENIDFSKEVA